MRWTQPLCEACWIDENTTTGNDEIAIRRPSRVTDPQTVEICCQCGYPTIVGIYVRRDPTTVPYPASERDDDDGI